MFVIVFYKLKKKEICKAKKVSTYVYKWKSEMCYYSAVMAYACLDSWKLIFRQPL